MSATFDDRPLTGLEVDQFELSEKDFANPVLAAKVNRPKPVFRYEVESLKNIADLVKAQHTSGNLSLVVLNTVARARELGSLLAELNPLVIHSRFLGFDREQLQKKINGFKGIIVATQVVEAGVDLDADLLITELCPWSSFVQRCGRCGRKRTDNSVQIYWLDYTQGWKPNPYADADCEDTRNRLLELSDASLYTLSQIPLPELKLPRYPLTDRNLETFFCTHYKNRDNQYTISQYVRDPDTFTVSVVWSDETPERLPHQRFLCPVPTEELKTFCKNCGSSPLVWGDDTWGAKIPTDGDVVWLPLSAGGYSHDRGWTADPEDKPQAYSLAVEPEYNDPPFPHNLPLGTHLKDTEAFLRDSIHHLQRLGFPDSLIQELCCCARWHDWGKAHTVWQSYANAHGELLAKSTKYGHAQEMGGYRHELASAFAAASQGVPFLSQYLIAAHHGKVRDSLYPTNPKERFNPKVLRGVELGSYLPSVEIEEVETLPPVQLNFPGKAEGWNKQVKGLLRELGPFKLIYLEAVIRNADVKASHYRQEEAKNDRNRNH
jgi:CRISPR-associated endonuclease/helicase Cas3